MSSDTSNVLNHHATLAEAVAAQAYDFQKYMDVFSDENGYDSSTKNWSAIYRTDSISGFFTLICPYSDRTYTTVDVGDKPLVEVSE